VKGNSLRGSISAGEITASDLYQFYYCRRKPVLEKVYGVSRVIRDKMQMGLEEHEKERKRFAERSEVYGFKKEEVEEIFEGKCVSYGELSGCPDVLIRKKDGSFSVVELKETDFTGDSYARKVQVYAYAYLIRKAYGVSNVSAFIYFIKQKKLVKVALPEDIDATLERAMSEYRSALSVEKIPETLKSSKCNYCEYFSFCWGAER